MERAEFERMVARLEGESERSPGLYKFKVGLLALGGFGLLAALLSFAGAGLLLLAGLVVGIVLSGGTLLLLLLKFGKVLLLLALPLWFLVKSAVSALFVRLPAPAGREITRREAPALFAAIDGMRRRMRGPRFHKVLLVDEMNAAVVQRPLFGLVGWPRNHLILGLPLLEATGPQEALAVVAHEYGHLAGSHGRFAAFIYRLRISWATIQAVAERWSGRAGRLLRKPVGWFAPYFNAYSFVLARADEYQADAASADLVGRDAAASALKRVGVGGTSYARFLQRTFEGVRSSVAPPADLAERWAVLAATPQAADAAQQFLADALQRDPGLDDTHPSLKQRLAALGVTEAEMDRLPPALEGGSAAQAWLGEAAGAIRREFQQRWSEQVARGWREQFEQWQQRRERLAQLRQQADKSAGAQLEELHLTVQLSPEDDHRAAAAAFNARHPDQPGGLYLEGMLLLERGDEAGLERLDRAMALDGDAIGPGCGRAFEFLKTRNDDRAEAYADRWRRRAAWEALRARQLQTLDADARLQSPDLSRQQRAQIAELVRGCSPYVAKAWIARRVLPADPGYPTYVLVAEMTSWARLRGKDGQVLEALARPAWPVHAFFTTGRGRYARLARQVKRLPDAALC